MRHVLDIVPLYQHPSSELLVDVLNTLALAPATFDGEDRNSKDDSPFEEEGVPRFLTSIVGSPLHWILDESTREQVWELASQRLAERSGRTAQPSFYRTFKVPCYTGGQAEIKLLEPSMTEDNLGLKTWASAYLLAKRIAHIVPSIPALQPTRPIPHVLELGAGTGLAGLALCIATPCIVHLTDLPAIVPNLVSNIESNKRTIESLQPRSQAHGFVLDWSDPVASPVPEQGRYDLILAADPLYSPEHPKMLADMIMNYLKKDKAAGVVIEIPLRESYAKEREELREHLDAAELKLFQSGTERGFDDWGNGKTEIECWWGLWKRR